MKSGFSFATGTEVSVFFTASDEPPIQSLPGLFPQGVKWTENEIYHSLPPNAWVKNLLIYTSASSYVLVWWCLIKNTEDFTFAFLCSC